MGMQRLYSQSTGCTYFKNFHGEVPDDAVAISEERFLEVLANPPLGKCRGHDAAGLPILIDPSAESMAELERGWRDREIDRVLWLRERHRDEQEMGRPLTLTQDQFNELLGYVQALRDWPTHTDFPTEDLRPTAPAWIAEQI
jgi:hypothetical protein